jgi:hypothetical protein
LRYLAPYRRIVLVSIVCAFGVGVITTTGLGAMLPILRVLLNDETILQAVDKQIVASTGMATTAPNLPWYWKLAHEGASHMPTHPVKAIAVCYAIIFVCRSSAASCGSSRSICRTRPRSARSTTSAATSTITSCTRR